MKSIVITGAAFGIGRAFAVTLDDPMETDELWLIDCDREGLQEIGEKLKTPSRQSLPARSRSAPSAGSTAG